MRTVFVLLHKLRCALMTANFATTRLSGVVMIDGGWFGGHVSPENHRPHRVDRVDANTKSGRNERRCLVVDAPAENSPTVTAVAET